MVAEIVYQGIFHVQEGDNINGAPTLRTHGGETVTVRQEIKNCVGRTWRFSRRTTLMSEKGRLKVGSDGKLEVALNHASGLGTDGANRQSFFSNRAVD